jgi:hypothetical protein
VPRRVVLALRGFIAQRHLGRWIGKVIGLSPQEFWKKVDLKRYYNSLC